MFQKYQMKILELKITILEKIHYLEVVSSQVEATDEKASKFNIDQ